MRGNGVKAGCSMLFTSHMVLMRILGCIDVLFASSIAPGSACACYSCDLNVPDEAASLSEPSRSGSTKHLRSQAWPWPTSKVRDLQVGQPCWLQLQQVTADGMALVGAPRQLIRNDATWEGPVVEAPFLVFRQVCVAAAVCKSRAVAAQQTQAPRSWC